MSQTYYAILTAVGEAKLANATALGTPLQISRMAVGDGNGVLPTPNRDQTTLVAEQYRADLNTLQTDPANASQVIAELVIPETTGGWWIREMGLYDAAGDLIAVSNCPPSYKPQMSEGSGRTQVLRMVLIVSSTAAVQLKIDPSVVLATRDFVVTTVATELAKLDSKQSVRVATTAPITLSGLQTIDGVALAAGDRVLVKNQATGSQNGIYVAASGAWSRAADADASLEVTPGMLVPVERGAVNGDSVWQLVTDFPIGLGTTSLIFEIATGPSGVAAGTYRSVTVDKRGRVTGGTNPTTLAGYGITDALGCKIGLETEAAEVSWNTLVGEGLHRRLIMGNNPDGPGPALHFYCRTYVRITPTASGGALQQFAEPYGTPTSAGQMYWRGMNGTTWTPWAKVVISDDHADQVAAETGTSTSLWMSPLRVFQAIAKKVVQATETVLGVAKVATQTQVNAGTDDATIVTPKKLRLGFAMSFTAASGYLLFPTWLGGALFQYGRATLSADTETSFTWPLAWPEACYALAGGVLTAASREQDGVAAQFRALTQTSVVINRQDIGTTVASSREIFVLGMGK
ncbi:phage tail protein [Stutzerimonas stutzeri]|uniref:phage tail-collar fiber domain-containing protein n=1 Tax=Stutzerimonas stutzeri TaxID=316 RepID=UPI000698B5EE|nr:phage tail protein [Stutzerimonas stutzeri]